MSEKQIEELVDRRFEDKIRPEIKNQVISVINKKIWIIASICIAIFGAVIGNMFYNNSRLVRMETRQDDFIQYNKDANAELRQVLKDMQQNHEDDVDKLNSKIDGNKGSFDGELDKISDNQSIIIYGLRHVDPNFNLDAVVRGSNKNGKMSN